jgi:hypothetical protein
VVRAFAHSRLWRSIDRIGASINWDKVMTVTVILASFAAGAAFVGYIAFAQILTSGGCR